MTINQLAKSIAGLCDSTADDIVGIVYETLADLGVKDTPERSFPALVGRVRKAVYQERGYRRTKAGYVSAVRMAERYRGRTSHRTERVDPIDPPDTLPVLGLESLPGRSGDVARMMAMGMSRPQMALALGVNVSEIQWTIASLRKTGATRVRLG